MGLIGCWACSEAGCCGGTVWSWTLHEASVLSQASCAPWEEGAAAFHTLPHIHCVCTLIVCVRVTVDVRVLSRTSLVFTLSRVTASSWHRESFSFIMMNVPELGWALDLYTARRQCQTSFTWHTLGCTRLHCITQNVSVIYHSRKVMRGRPPPSPPPAFTEHQDLSVKQSSQCVHCPVKVSLEESELCCNILN